MKILIIGGTKFLGRHLLDAALENNHEVTLFNRGKKYSDEEIPSVEEVHGDRNFELEKLSGRKFDAVIDTCGYLPQTVKKSAEFFADKANQYVFISSGSVYQYGMKADYDETAETAKLSESEREKFENFDLTQELNGIVLGESYGALKKLCEESAEKAMPNRVLNVRAGMIVGEFDWTDRFNYWVMRIEKGGEILAPGSGKSFVQLVDAKDLSEWIIKAIEENLTGIFNVTSKSLDLTFDKFLEEIKSATKSNAEFIWASEEFLTENKVAPWSEMPFYLPESDGNYKNFLTMNVDKALENGLKFRPLGETVLDVKNWREKQNFEMKAGISREREKELLEKIK